MRNPLTDLDFLRKLDLKRNKATYAKIILLTNDELPVYEIQGKITAGSVNIDGASAVRRTCSLTMVSPDVDITNTYWALKNKFKLEVGVENEVDSTYPEIIWFKQGLYVFTGLNMNVQSNNFTISINGKDKGCLINGEIGGSINASTDFGKLEEYQTLDSGEIIRNIIDIPIVDIIRNAVHVYAGEPLHNIVINDVDEYGLELLEYRGDTSLYLPRQVVSGEVTNMVIDGTKENYYFENSATAISLDNSQIIYYDRTEKLPEDKATKVYPEPNCSDKNKAYQIIKIDFGDTGGYRRTELTYPGDLIANVGESLASVLDKIKNMFSDFEYFYDIDGRFIFQKKKTYINTSWNNLTQSDEDIYAADAAYTSATTYTFEEGVLLTAFTDAPTITNIRNDFSIWGKRESVSGAEIPVHMRYAIDFKPEYYFPIRFEYDLVNWEDKEEFYEANKYYIVQNGKMILSTSKEKNSEIDYYKITDRQILEGGAQLPSDEVINPFAINDNLDWRELIYQMALDYFKYNHIKNNFTQLVAAANPNHYPTGITGYEEYYTDMQGFWRQLYNPGVKDISFITSSERKQIARDILTDKEEEVTDEKIAAVTDAEIQAELEKEYNPDYWHKNVTQSPEVLNFWFDFMDVGGDMGKYATSAIGNRPKAINDDNVKAIYFEQTPTVLFLTEDEEYSPLEHQGYTFIRLTPQMENYFSISAQGKSAQDELDNLLYQHTYATEAVTLTAVPIYHLQPNTRVFVKDKNTGINGEYIVSKITIPLQYNGTTSITTTKAVERIY